jgi:hypothetical protein
MTISTEERPAALEQAERRPPAVGRAAPPTRTDEPPPRPSAVDPRWTWVEVEEVDPPGARTDWMTRFAWAKTVGGW